MRILILMWMTLSTLFASIGSVTFVQGTAELSREAAVSTIEKGTAIEQKDKLETQKRSRVQVILNDETIITIGPESRYIFERFQEGGDAEVVMTLEQGIFKAITGKIGKLAPQRFKIKTKAATIGIRGTQFMALVEGSDEKIGCTQGSLVVETAETTFELPAGRMLVYEDGQWSMYALQRDAFSGVTADNNSAQKSPLQEKSELLPSYPESYVPQEQLTDKEHGQF